MHPSDPPNPPAVVGMLLVRALPECSATAIADLGALFHRHAVAKSGGLLSQGQVWRDALLVEQGLLRLYFVRRDGREFNKNFFTDGALFCPLTPAMWNDASLFAIASLDAGTVWRADSAAMRRCLEIHGQWQVVRGRMLEGLITHKLQREHDLSTLDGRRRYEAFCRREPVDGWQAHFIQAGVPAGLVEILAASIDRPVLRDERARLLRAAR